MSSDIFSDHPDDLAGLPVADELLKEFPTLTSDKKERLKISIDVASNGIKTDLLKELQKFEKPGAQPANGRAFRRWLQTNREKYETWLLRL